MVYGCPWSLRVQTSKGVGKVIGVGVHLLECGSTLYVGKAHPAPPINTNFQITFLLTQLLEALYEDLPV